MVERQSRKDLGKPSKFWYTVVEERGGKALVRENRSLCALRSEREGSHRRGSAHSEREKKFRLGEPNTGNMKARQVLLWKEKGHNYPLSINSIP